MLQWRLLASGILLASQALLANGFNHTRPLKNIVDIKTPEILSAWQQNVKKGEASHEKWEQATKDSPLSADLIESLRNVYLSFLNMDPPNFEGLPEILNKYEVQGKGFSIVENLPECLVDITPSDNPNVLPNLHGHARYSGAQVLSLVSASQGVFINEVDTLSTDQTSGALTYPALAWYMWTRAVQREYPEKESSPPYDNMQLYMKVYIQEPQTSAQISDMLSTAGKRGRDILTVNEKENGFFALLGTPVGAELMEILTKNKLAMNGKGVRQISVQRGQWQHISTTRYPIASYHMWADLGPKRG